MVNKLTKWKIISLYLNDYSKSYYLAEFANLLNKPHQSIKPYIEALIKEKIIVKQKRIRVLDYKLNFSEKKVYDYLVLSEKEKILERLQEDTLLKVLFDKLSGHFEKSTFVLFGSFSTGAKAKDIDLLVIGRENIKKIAEDFETIYNKQIHIVQVSSLEKLSPALAKEIYKKHLILNNTEQIIRWLGGLYEKNKLV